jgi:hypothetical protein
MRLWSIHPEYLDARGLVALWREGLLAQRVLLGGTRGYAHHPQLARFREYGDPILAIGSYLYHVHAQAAARGYSFDASRILRYDAGLRGILGVNAGQARCELIILRRKLIARSPEMYRALDGIEEPELNPIFRPREGPVEAWEKSRECARLSH